MQIIARLKLAPVALLAAGCSTTQISSEKYIRDSEAQWAESVATSDASVVRRILADDVVWVYPGGTLYTKAQAVADAESGPGDFIPDHLDGVSVRFFGDMAAAKGSETWERRRKNGEIHTGRFVWTDTWLHRDGRWQIVAAENQVAPALDPPATPPAKNQA